MSKRATVAILGASGFIGYRLAEWLVLRELADVRPIVRSFKGFARVARFDLDCRVADATDQRALEPHLRGCQIAFHCVVGGRETILKSIEAAYHAAAAAGVQRLVYLSSAVVHGNNPRPGTHDDTELLLKQPFEYNVSKVLAERRLNELRRDGKVETVVLRPCIVFGPRSQWWTAQIATDLVLRKAYLAEGGAGVCNTIYVDNLVDAMWLAATRPAAANQTFLLTDGERVTWRDLYSSVADALGISPAGIANVPAGDIDALLRRQRLEKVKQNRIVRLAKGFMTANLRRTAGKLVSAAILQEGGDATGGGSVIDIEIVRLQQCNYMLPIDKARSLLGYEPQIGFKEASLRTAAWLRFALGVLHNSDLSGHADRRLGDALDMADRA